MVQTSNRIFDEMAKLMNDAAGAAQGVRREVDTVCSVTRPNASCATSMSCAAMNSRRSRRWRGSRGKRTKR